MADSQEPRAVLPETNGLVYLPNGINGDDHRPVTPPQRNGMSLTEYSANPKTPSPERRQRIKGVVPDDFLLEDGNPDVCATPRCDTGSAFIL